MDTITIILLAITGLVIGSFLNVVIFRLPLGESIAFPPSHCGKCGHRLQPLDLIPVVSWCFLKGRCRYCKERISAQYPAVELGTACMLVFVWLRCRSIEEFVISAVAVFVLIPVTVIDIRHYVIKDKLLLVLLVPAAGAAALNLFAPERVEIFYDMGAPWSPLAGMLLGAGVLFAIGMIGSALNGGRTAMGMGDVKLMGVLGLLCGGRHTAAALLAAVLLAAGVAVYALFVLKKGRKTKMAFGPFLIIGFYLAVYL